MKKNRNLVGLISLCSWIDNSDMSGFQKYSIWWLLWLLSSKKNATFCSFLCPGALLSPSQDMICSLKQKNAVWWTSKQPDAGGGSWKTLGVIRLIMTLIIAKIGLAR